MPPVLTTAYCCSQLWVLDVDRDSDHASAQAKYCFLFQCRGGIHRSAAAICVLLMQFKGLALLQRNSLRLWRSWGRMLEALLDFESRANRGHHDAFSAATHLLGQGYDAVTQAIL